MEILLSTGIGLLLILFVAKTFLDYQQMSLKQRETARIQATFQRILMMMKSELIQAGYKLDSYQEGIQITDEWIQIQKDGNLDGDLGDSREDIVYRFFPDDQKLSRKSGQGYFQILLEPIYSVFFRLILQILSLIKAFHASGSNFNFRNWMRFRKHHYVR